MGSIVGRESEEIGRLQDAIESVLAEPDANESARDLAEVVRNLQAEIELARERYWRRTQQLHELRETLKLSG